MTTQKRQDGNVFKIYMFEIVSKDLSFSIKLWRTVEAWELWTDFWWANRKYAKLEFEQRSILDCVMGHEQRNM